MLEDSVNVMTKEVQKKMNELELDKKAVKDKVFLISILSKILKRDKLSDKELRIKKTLLA